MAFCPTTKDKERSQITPKAFLKNVVVFKSDVLGVTQSSV